MRGRIKKHSWREASPGALVVKNPSASVGVCKRCRFDPWVGKIHWRRKWHPTPVFLPGKSHGQRSLVGYSPWGCKRVRHDLATKTTTTQQHTSYVKLILPVIKERKEERERKSLPICDILPVKVALSCLTLCYPMYIQSMKFSSSEYWSG